MLDSNIIILLSGGGKNGNMICRPVKAEIRLFEVQLRIREFCVTHSFEILSQNCRWAPLADGEKVG